MQFFGNTGQLAAFGNQQMQQNLGMNAGFMGDARAGAAGQGAAPGGAAGANSFGSNGYNPQVASTYMKALTDQWNQARQANQNQLAQMQGIAANYGQGALGYSNQLTQQQQAEGAQQMASRGLYNSTVAQGVSQAAQNQGALRNNMINDQTAQMQLGVLGQNQIQYPSMSTYAQLMSQPGAFSGNNGTSALLGALTSLNYGGGGQSGVQGGK